MHARSQIDVFDESTSAARWSEGTWRTVTRGYGYWLGYLHANGMLTEERAPAEIVTPELVSKYIEHIRLTVAASSVEIYVYHLSSAMKVIARDRDWSWLRDTAKRLHTFVKPVSKMGRLVPAEQLYDLGHQLMSQVTQTAPSQRRKRRLLYRDGLMIAMLAARPLRRSNFAHLRIGRHLIKLGNTWVLQVPSTDTKNHRSIETPLPSDLHDPLQTFLRTYRPDFPNVGLAV